MSEKILRFKQPLSGNDTVFFVFEIVNNVTFALYDSGMGDPIKYGSIAVISGKLEEEMKKAKNKKRKKFKVYWMVKDAAKGWKENIQPRSGYSTEGIVNDMPTPEKNTVHTKLSMPRGFPVSDMDQIYWFFLGPQGNNIHLLYDSEMGSPLWGENKQKIVAFLQKMDEDVREKKRKKYVLWCFERRNENEIWEKKTLKYLPQFKVDSVKKNKIVENDKKEQPEDKKAGQ